MKNFLLASFALFIFSGLSAQFVAKMEVKGPLPGACDSTNVYALFPGFTGQMEAKCALTKQEIEDKLNKEVKFLSLNPKFKGKLMVNIIVNCKGNMIKCEIDNKSGDNDLDSEVVAVFRTLTFVSPGTLNGQAVDTSLLYSMEVKKGVIHLT